MAVTRADEDLNGTFKELPVVRLKSIKPMFVVGLQRFSGALAASAHFFTRRHGKGSD
jgi:hypothetical protein